MDFSSISKFQTGILFKLTINFLIDQGQMISAVKTKKNKKIMIEWKHG
jgi:hypothetical protein